jgi:hypothetical protein
LTETGIFALERHAAVAERAHDSVGQVVSTVVTRRITARHLEKCRGVRNNDTTDVGDFCGNGTGAPLFKVEPEIFESGDLSLQARRIVFTTTTLGKAVRRISVPSIHQANTCTLSTGRNQAAFGSHRLRKERKANVEAPPEKPPAPEGVPR